MRLENIECQLAQGQLNRYLAGESLSETALSQLEEHLAGCTECKERIAEKRRTLQQITTSATAAIEMEEPAPQPAPPGSPVPKFLIDAIRNKKHAPPKTVAEPVTQAVIEVTQSPPPAPNAWIKPLLYSLGLAGVLIAMSTILKDPTKFFGSTVAGEIASKKAETPAKSTSTASKTVSTASTTTKTNEAEIEPAPENVKLSEPLSTGNALSEEPRNDDPIQNPPEAETIEARQPEPEKPKATTKRPTSTRRAAAASTRRRTATKARTTKRPTTTRRRPTPAAAPKSSVRVVPEPGVRIVEGN